LLHIGGGLRDDDNCIEPGAQTERQGQSPFVEEPNQWDSASPTECLFRFLFVLVFDLEQGASFGAKAKQFFLLGFVFLHPL